MDVTQDRLLPDTSAAKWIAGMSRVNLSALRRLLIYTGGIILIYLFAHQITQSIGRGLLWSGLGLAGGALAAYGLSYISGWIRSWLVLIGQAVVWITLVWVVGTVAYYDFAPDYVIRAVLVLAFLVVEVGISFKNYLSFFVFLLFTGTVAGMAIFSVAEPLVDRVVLLTGLGGLIGLAVVTVIGLATVRKPSKSSVRTARETSSDIRITPHGKLDGGDVRLLTALRGEDSLEPLQNSGTVSVKEDTCNKIGNGKAVVVDDQLIMQPFCVPQPSANDKSPEPLDTGHLGYQKGRDSKWYRHLFEKSPDPISITTVDGVLLDYNPATEELFESLKKGINVKNLYVYPKKREELRHLLEENGYVRDFEAKLYGSDNTPITCLITSVVYYDKSRGRNVYQSFVRNVTHRRRLEREVLQVSQKERWRIGQDLHDGLGQMLTGLQFLSKNLVNKLYQEKSEAAQQAEEIYDLLKEVDEVAHDLAQGLSPVQMDSGGLVAALQRLTATSERLFGVSCSFCELNKTSVPNKTAATNLYRIAQEAISNAVKHGQAKQIAIRLGSDEHQVHLCVQDDGSGFENAEASQAPGLGLRIMHHRVRVIGGALQISTHPEEGGTILHCTVPQHEATAPNSPEPGALA